MELMILDFIQQNFRSDIMDKIMIFITSLGDSGRIWIGCTIVLLLIPKTRKAGMAMAIALVLEILCCNIILKPFVARVRPCDINTSIKLLVARPSDYSFPSGHTASSFAAAAALFFSRKKIWIPASVLAGLIAFSRLYLYVHYPTDVLAGILIGIMLGWAGALLAGLAFEKLGNHLNPHPGKN